MFKKLRNQLVLINVIIIAVLFSLLILAAYCLAHHDMHKRADFMTKRAEEEINAGIFPRMHNHDKNPNDPPPNASRPPDFPPPPPPQNFFFLKVNDAGKITFISESAPLQSAQLSDLIERIKLTNSTKGLTDMGQARYYFSEIPLKNEAGSLILFHDLTPEITMLNTVLLALVIVGLFCMVISFFCSLFLANRAMLPVEKNWRQQKEFIADASHELRTPLTVIQTNLAVLRDNPAETVATQEKWLTHIAEEVKQMTQLVNSLLFIARADAEQDIGKPETFSMETIIRTAVRPFRPVAAEKELFLNITIKEDCLLKGNPTKIKQLIGILLDNALNFTPAHGSITVALSEQEGCAVISVTDTGDGIAAEHLPRIFDRFYQADQSRSGSGSGLGLSIAKLIVEQHQGNIKATSTPGEGTTFTITLPISRKILSA